jgi:hypothetical protein
MRRHRVAKRRAAVVGIIALAGLLAFGGLGARAVAEASAFFGVNGPTTETCGQAVLAAYNDYAETLSGLAPVTESEDSIKARAADLVGMETRLTDAVIAAPCPDTLNETITTFVARQREYIPVLQRVANGELGLLSDGTFQRANRAADAAWNALTVATGIAEQ